MRQISVTAEMKGKAIHWKVGFEISWNFQPVIAQYQYPRMNCKQELFKSVLMWHGK